MKRLLAAVCGIAFFVGLLSLKPAAVTGLYFTGVNDQLLSLSSATMPLVRDGTVYAPYSIFNPDVAKASVGVFFSRNSSAKTITLFGMQKLLIFDLSAGNCRDLEKTYSAKALVRNGITYLPAYFVCNYFGLDYSYLSTDLGPLIRIKNSDAVLSDYAFVKAATQLMQQYLREYQNGRSPVTEAAPPPTASPSFPPSFSGNGSASSPPAPMQTWQPSSYPTQEKTTESKKKLVYLAFSCSAKGAGQKILNTLDGRKIGAFFFFRPEDLRENDDLVRHIVASGYGIGLTLTGKEADMQQTLSQGVRDLASIARVSTRILLAPDVANAQKSALAQSGYLFWAYNTSASYHSSSPSVMVQDLESKISGASSISRVLLGDSGVTAGALPAFLGYLEAGNFEIQQITETDG
ncbi:MAG: hypothetical protein PHT34_01210 [Oscillospiraceae bacterium]|nr:hypothetical protein [Oscillospiraceae bacterium]